MNPADLIDATTSVKPMWLFRPAFLLPYCFLQPPSAALPLSAVRENNLGLPSSPATPSPVLLCIYLNMLALLTVKEV